MIHPGRDLFYSSNEFQNFFQRSLRSLVLKTDAPRFTIMAVSDTYLDLVHKQREEVLGLGLFEAFPGSEGDPSEAGSVMEALLEVIDTQRTVIQPIFKYEIYVPETDAYETHYWHNQHEAILDQASGTVAYIINTTTNITERIRLEQEVKKGRERELSLMGQLAARNRDLTAINDALYTANTELKASNADIRRLNIELQNYGEQLQQINQTLSESEERFRSMAEGSGVLIGVGDTTGEAIYFNQAWSRLTGKPIEELLGTGWSSLIHPDDKDDYLDLYMTSVKNKLPYTGEYRIFSASGEYRWLLAFASPRFEPDGSFAGFIGSFVDITERKRDEQRKVDFISMVSHELKTPITSLNGFLQVLRTRAAKAEDTLAVGFLDKCMKQVRKVTDIINGFLNVSRLESGKVHIDKQPFDMAELVKEAEEESLAAITTHRVVFAPVEHTPVMADKNKIAQVVTNLINNAVKYSPQGSVINVACVTANDVALVSVKDEGMGVAPNDIKKLFDRYYRVESHATRSIAGFGIGLYFCKEIIERHEGTIAVKSELGKGSTFYFTIPVLSSVNNNDKAAIQGEQET